MTLLHRLAICAIILFGSVNAHATTCTAIANGDWSNPAAWSCGSIPGCGDTIVIPLGVTVNVDMMVKLDENSSPACSTAVHIDVYGTLQFVTGFKMELSCGSTVEIFIGGSMLPGGGGGSSNWLYICQNLEWKAAHGPVFGYRIFGVPMPLPVEFIEFNVRNEQNVYDFSWTVASERENDFFLIQYSIDGINWFDFIEINSIGDHTDFYTYNENGNELEGITASTIYFKLSQTDFNGKTSDLEVKSISPSRAEYSIYPNPINQNQKLNVSIYSDSKVKSDVLFYNPLGTLILTESIYLEEGLNNQEVQINGLNRGIYLVKIPNGLSEQMVRLVIE